MLHKSHKSQNLELESNKNGFGHWFQSYLENTGVWNKSVESNTFSKNLSTCSYIELELWRSLRKEAGADAQEKALHHQERVLSATIPSHSRNLSTSEG